MTDIACSYTAGCLLPADSDQHLPGCPALDVAADEPMFPTPQMDYTLSEPATSDPLGLGIPVAFYLGLGTGLVLAILAVLAGLLVAVA